MSGTREGSPQSYKRGSLKRRLPTVVTAQLTAVPGEGTPLPTVDQRLVLRGIQNDLKIQIVCSAVGPQGSPPIRPEDVPVNATVFQLTPVNVPGDSPRTYIRPVFQDPSLAQNENHPLPQDIPFGWEFQTGCDEIEIDITHDTAAWAVTGLTGQIVVEVWIDYDGQWWDTEAIRFAISQVNLSGIPQPVAISTTGL